MVLSRVNGLYLYPYGEKRIQEIAQINSSNRLKQEFLHRTGKKPLTVLKKERSDKGLPVDRLNMFIISREGAEDVTTQRMISKFQDTTDELKAANKDTPEELENLFIDNFGKDKHGRMRCLGRGITASMVYGRRSGVLNKSAETLTAIHAEFEKKFELQKQETESRILAEREACKTKMEVRIEAFKQELLSQLAVRIG